ncbi:MAG: hypothetical protein ACYC4Q_08445 [Victivallaceae bacterium]
MEIYGKLISVLVGFWGVLGSIASVVTAKKIVRYPVLGLGVITTIYLCNNPEKAAQIFDYITGNAKAVVEKVVTQLHVKTCEKCTNRGPLTVSLVSFSDGAGFLEICNMSNNTLSITLVNFISIETKNASVNLNQSGTIAGSWGLFNDPCEECVKGNITPQNRTIIQAQEKLRVPFRPKDAKTFPEITNGAFLSLPLCYRVGDSGKGEIWKAQIPLI